MISLASDRLAARARRMIACLFACLACGVAGAPTSAQSPSEAADRAAARKLASEGFADLEHGEWAAAETSFTRALAFHRAPTLYLARGRARLQLGWLIAASEDFRSAASFETSAEETPAYANARTEAAAAWRNLEKRLPTLTVQIMAGQLQELRVNGALWPLESEGVARQLDPGRYVVEARDVNGQVHNSTVQLQESSASVVSFSLPEQVSAPSPAAVSSSVLHERAVEAAPPLALREVSKPASSPPAAAWVSGGVTLALVVGAVVTGVMALNRRADFNDNNKPDVAQARKDELRSRFSTLAWTNTALWGGALVGGGVTAYFLLSTPASDKDPAASRPQGAQAGVRVAF